jgi:hypothetical protein
MEIGYHTPESRVPQPHRILRYRQICQSPDQSQEKTVAVQRTICYTVPEAPKRPPNPPILGGNPWTPPRIGGLGGRLSDYGRFTFGSSD